MIADVGVRQIFSGEPVEFWKDNSGDEFCKFAYVWNFANSSGYEYEFAVGLDRLTSRVKSKVSNEILPVRNVRHQNSGRCWKG